MERCYKKILAFMLALALTITGLNFNGSVTVMAGAATQGTTESADNPMEPDVNSEVFFVNAANGKLISLNGIVNDPISCSTTYNEGDRVPTNAKFTVYYGDGTTEASDGKTVVNFTTNATQTSWKADGDKVYQMTKRTNPSGWESVIIEAQGDGTICFRSCANGKYFTVNGNSLGLVEINEEESPSNNEKFIMYTEQAPKTAKKVTLDNVSGDSVDITWQGVTHTLYSGYEVLYSKEEDRGYISAGLTKDTSFKITNLELNTRYFFKIRTLTNGKDGAYADSKVAYIQTLKAKKPAQPAHVKVEATEKGAMTIRWDKANSASRYKVYRAVSRMSEYVEIGETTDTTFTDTNPNTDSKYNNYYKIQGVNDYDSGNLSEPGSLEISMFGLNTYIFSETDDLNQIYEATQQVYRQQHRDQFGDGRYTFAYKEGDYSAMEQDCLNVGYYTQTIGLGKLPTDVRLKNVRTPAALSGNNATCNFWVDIENLTIADTDKTDSEDQIFSFQWAVSQAAPARRLNVERRAAFDWYYGWASGGYVADSVFQKAAGSYPQQQYYYRNCELQGGTYGINWNQVIQGCVGVTADNSKDNTNKSLADAVNLINNNGVTNWNQRGCTTILNNTDVIREKPYLFFDKEQDAYKVFVPALRKNSSGVSWSSTDMGEGEIIDVDKTFYIANPAVDTADTINKQLDWGRNILFAPGIYHLNKPLEVKYADTILLGMGMATLIPDNDEAAIKTADVGGISICGLILDAGNYSDTLLTVGNEGCNKDHSDNPTVLQDVIYRVGGTGSLGRCASCQVINSNDVIIDHTWIWRADHGDNTGWTENTSNNGLIVNGNNVTAYGLFVEHFQEYDVLWRGENGKTYFVQNEKCYDPQSQDSWMSHAGSKQGYAAYKIANNVKNHYAVGVGVYDVFINTNGASIYLDNAIEVPDTPNVLIENACIVEIADGEGPKVGINHIVNGTTAGIRTGAGQGTNEVKGGYAIQRLLSYSNGDSLSLPDYYEVVAAHGSIGNEPPITSSDIVTEVGQSPARDANAEKNIKKEASSVDSEIPLWEMTDQLFEEKQDECYKKWLEGQKKPEVPEEDNKKDPVKEHDYYIKKYGLKVGQTFESGKYLYKITSLSGRQTVQLVKVLPKYKKKIKKANIASSVTYKTFKLKITSIRAKAFTKCKKLKSVKTGSNVQTIGKKAFYNCKKLKTVTIGKAAKTIGKSAFAKCKNIQKVTIGKNVKTIKSKAFAGSKKLKRVVLKGKKLKKVAKNAFHKKVRKTMKITGKKKSKKVLLKSLKRKK